MMFRRKRKYESNIHTNNNRVLNNNLETLKCCDTTPLEPDESRKRKYELNTHTNNKRVLDNNLETLKCCDTPPLEPDEVFNVLDDYTWKYIFGYLNHEVDTKNIYITCKRWFEIINKDRIKITNFETLEDAIKHDDVYSLSFVDTSNKHFQKKHKYAICNLAAKHGSLNCLHWACEQNYEWSSWTCDQQMAKWDVKIIYAYKNGCLFHKKTWNNGMNGVHGLASSKWSNWK